MKIIKQELQFKEKVINDYFSQFINELKNIVAYYCNSYEMCHNLNIYFVYVIFLGGIFVCQK